MGIFNQLVILNSCSCCQHPKHPSFTGDEKDVLDMLSIGSSISTRRCGSRSGACWHCTPTTTMQYLFRCFYIYLWAWWSSAGDVLGWRAPAAALRWSFTGQRRPVVPEFRVCAFILHNKVALGTISIHTVVGSLPIPTIRCLCVC